MEYVYAWFWKDSPAIADIEAGGSVRLKTSMKNGTIVSWAKGILSKNRLALKSDQKILIRGIKQPLGFVKWDTAIGDLVDIHSKNTIASIIRSIKWSRKELNS